MVRNTVSSLAGLFLAFAMVAPAAAQQVNPEQGDTGGGWGQPQPQQGGQQWQQPQPQGQPQQGQWQQPPQGQPQQGGWQQGQPQQGQQGGWGEQQPAGWGNPDAPPPGGATPPPATGPANNSDHGRSVGHFGLGFLGTVGIPIVDASMGAGVGNAELSAPTIGIRYWFSRSFGIDAAIGLGLAAPSASAAGMSIDGLPAPFGLAFRAGIPISLYDADHYNFLIAPQLGLGFSTASSGDNSLNGLFFEIGARAGAEIHFGFIGIPQLSLQGTVGLLFRYESRSVAGATVAGDRSFSTVSLGTSVQAEPWDIFTGNISAIYYIW